MAYLLKSKHAKGTHKSVLYFLYKSKINKDKISKLIYGRINKRICHSYKTCRLNCIDETFKLLKQLEDYDKEN